MPRKNSPSLLFLIGAICIVAVMSFVSASVYRGIVHDEVVESYSEGAELIRTGQALFDPEHNVGEPKLPARFLYLALIALGQKLVGINVLALHLFPYLLQILNPCLFFILAYRLYHNVWWAGVAAILFMLHPFNLVFLNQPYGSSIFEFLLLMLILFFEIALKKPHYLVPGGIVALLLILTRFEGGLIFVSVLFGIYILLRWKDGIPWKWIVISTGAFVVIAVLFAWLFRFPISFPLQYIPHILHRQAEAGANSSFYGLTKQAARIFFALVFLWEIPGASSRHFAFNRNV